MLRLPIKKKIRVKLPKGTRVTAIGDIHGQTERLIKLMKKVDKYREANPVENDYIIFLGDYVDRGPNSAEIIEYLNTRRLKAKTSTTTEVFLQGNHEDLLLESLTGESDRLDLWWRNGGKQTVQSYLSFCGFNDSELCDDKEMMSILRDHFPKKHRKFFKKLRDCYKVGPLLFVHAGIRMDVPIKDQSPADMHWIRELFLNWKGEEKDFLVVHGHTITPSFRPVIKKHRIGIDTGSYRKNGKITAAVFEGKHVRFMSSGTKRNFVETLFS